MCRACLLLAVVVPIVFAASPLREGARKEFIELSVRGDSGAATRFELKTSNFAVFPRVDSSSRHVAPVTITIAGRGSAELVSADSGRLVVADMRLTTREGVFTARYTGRAVRIERTSLQTPFSITTR